MRSSTLRALAVASATLALSGLAAAQSPTSTTAPRAQRSMATQDTTHRGARSHRMAARPASKPKTMKVKEQSPGLAAQATISADSAQAIALAQVPNGRIREAELENEKGTLVYSYDVKAPGKSGVEEILVDAKTGAVVSQTHESAAAEKKEMAGEHRAKRSMHKSSRAKSDSSMKRDSTSKP